MQVQEGKVSNTRNDRNGSKGKSEKPERNGLNTMAVAVTVGTIGTTRNRTMLPTMNPTVRATVKFFADELRRERGISPTMMQTQIEVTVERLREEHGIEVSEERFAKMVGVR